MQKHKNHTEAPQTRKAGPIFKPTLVFVGARREVFLTRKAAKRWLGLFPKRIRRQARFIVGGAMRRNPLAPSGYERA